MTKGLAGLVREASKIGILEWIRVGSKKVEVKLLQSVVDILFFCQLQLQCVLAIKVVLRSFEIVSRLKVNFYKSHVRGIRLSKEDSVVFSSYLNDKGKISVFSTTFSSGLMSLRLRISIQCSYIVLQLMEACIVTPRLIKKEFQEDLRRIREEDETGKERTLKP